MPGYSHLTAAERDRIADLKADGLSLQAIGRSPGRAASTISREVWRLDSGAYRPHVADGAYLLRRQRAAALETEAKLATYVTDRLAEGCFSAIWRRRRPRGARPSNRVFRSYVDIVALCCDAWNNLVDRPWKIMSIGMRQWAHG